ncbi:uncharacterized protein LOC115033908 [Acyrthosiphon pisum]|uniref:FLYWCH-type domain-containing protein n=1 Tax=Acyrthosiphon pisum TaxID=7029 RepID=A0A8R2NRL4_ACYPI|nr:uncharacterized protein LOC115033908 [Acyrthosiphon pisum]
MSERNMSQENNSIKLITGKRGNLLVVFKNYKYSKNKKYASGEIKWRCNNKNCNAFIKTVGAEQHNIALTHFANDTHITSCLPISIQTLEKQEISSCVKRKTVEDIRDKPGMWTNRFQKPV